MFKSITSFYGWSKKWRRQFGPLRGLRVAWGFRRAVWGSGQGELVSIGVEGILEEYGLERIDLRKIDIEGAEVEVFTADVTRWIDRLGMLAVEVDDRYPPGSTGWAH